MKKKVMRIIYVLCACCAVFVFTASAQTAFINKPSSATVTSSPVGLAKSATYFASAYNFSPSTVTARCQAAFAGSVYSTEASFTLKAGQSSTRTDTQTKDSSFRLQLTGAGNGEGYVTC